MQWKQLKFVLCRELLDMAAEQLDVTPDQRPTLTSGEVETTLIPLPPPCLPPPQPKPLASFFRLCHGFLSLCLSLSRYPWSFSVFYGHYHDFFVIFGLFACVCSSKVTVLGLACQQLAVAAVKRSERGMLDLVVLQEIEALTTHIDLLVAACPQEATPNVLPPRFVAPGDAVRDLTTISLGPFMAYKHVLDTSSSPFVFSSFWTWDLALFLWKAHVIFVCVLH